MYITRTAEFRGNTFEYLMELVEYAISNGITSDPRIEKVCEDYKAWYRTSPKFPPKKEGFQVGSHELLNRMYQDGADPDTIVKVLPKEDITFLMSYSLKPEVALGKYIWGSAIHYQISAVRAQVGLKAVDEDRVWKIYHPEEPNPEIISTIGSSDNLGATITTTVNVTASIIGKLFNKGLKVVNTGLTVIDKKLDERKINNG